MLAKSLAVVALTCVLVVALLLTARAQDAFVGKWVLDPSASTAAPGMMRKSTAVEISDAGGGKYTSVSSATFVLEGGGREITQRNEITFAIDGKDYAVTMTVTGATQNPRAAPVTQSFERVRGNRYISSTKLDGKLVETTVTEISIDGNTLTQTMTGAGELAGSSRTLVFNRQ